MSKQSLTFILTVLISVISGCTTTTVDNKNFIDVNDISRVLNANKLRLNYSLSNVNKEYFMSALLNKEFEFDVKFDKNGRKLNNNLLDSNLSFFCNSYIEDQRSRLNLSLYKEIDNQKDILVIYSEEFIAQADELKLNYPNSKFYFLNSKNNFEDFTLAVIGIDSSVKRFDDLQKNDSSIVMKYSPREKKDFKKIYFLTEYNIGKSLVPIFRSYLIDTEFYSTIDILLGASSIKELNDFENIIIPVPSFFFENLTSKIIVENLKDELSKELVEDLILAESIYQNNFYGKNVKFNSGMAKVNRGQCIKRKLTMMKVSLN
ncbi:hypothetical protein OAM80_03690 [Gammaproteobacteria bacterium]|nr:hypothetical protein [Gammaproteobacteria bacterium]